MARKFQRRLRGSRRLDQSHAYSVGCCVSGQLLRACAGGVGSDGVCRCVQLRAAAAGRRAVRRAKGVAAAARLWDPQPRAARCLKQAERLEPGGEAAAACDQLKSW